MSQSLVLTMLLCFGPTGKAIGQTVTFVRGGIALESSGDVVISQGSDAVRFKTLELDRDRRILLFDWQPRTEYQVRIGDVVHHVRSPQKPAPYLIRTIPLEDVSESAATGSAPDAVVKFAPDGRRLAIGTFGGWLRVVDCYTGRLLEKRRIAEGMVKRLAWSPDGKQLYVGEQSPDGTLAALDADDGYRVKWSIRTADQLGTSAAPPGDRYGVYTLPGIYDLHVVADGRVFAAGVHSWSTADGRHNASQIYSLAADGTTLWRFQADEPLSMNVPHIAVDAAGAKLLLFGSQTQTAPPTNSIIDAGTLYQLDAEHGETTAQFGLQPLRPHFERVESWDSLAISADGTRAAIGLGDGRVLLFASTKDDLRLLKEFRLGTPVVVGTIPLAAHASYTRFFGDELIAQTQNTHIPFGNPQAANQAPSAHRGANTLLVADRDGTPEWRYRGPYSLGGNWSAASRARDSADWLLVPCRESPGAAEPGNFGFLLFDLSSSGGGRERLVYHYPTAGPVVFTADMSPDGTLAAVVEVPAAKPDGRDLYGKHQVHMVH